MPRRTTEPLSSPETLREALYEMVHRSDAPAKAQADELGVSYSYLCNAANSHLDGEFEYQLRLLIPHIKLTGSFAVLDLIERALGRVAIPVLPLDGGVRLQREAADLTKHLCSIVKEMGDVASAFQKSVKDGKVTADEARRCRKELWDLIQAAARSCSELEGVEGVS